MSAIAKLFDGYVLNKSKEKVNLKDKKYKGKVIGLYFSAHWCSPCRTFTPILIDFYKEHHKDKNFEIIFISADNDEESYEEYYKNMPWLTLDYEQQEKKEELEAKFKVNGIPTLLLVEADTGKILCQDATDQIHDKDKEGENFPWEGEEEDEDDE